MTDSCVIVRSARRRLADARLYLCTDARSGPTDLAAFADTVLDAGVDVIQLRHKGIEAADELAALAVLRAACDRHGGLLAVNDRADVAVLARADVLHLGQRDLSPAQARTLVGPDVILGRSTHALDQAAAADADPDVDYFCAGPVWATPTKPGRTAVGVEYLRAVAASTPATPWFAIGGIDPPTVDAVVAAGARRVVVVRAVTGASDPASAVRALRAALPGD
jgi:thiamine-phosphate pyrophosphorylase